MTDKTDTPKTVHFISMRWRFIFPLFVTLLLVSMIGAYLAARNFSGGLKVSQTNVLLQSVRAAAQRTADLYNRQRTEAQRIAFTLGVAEAIRDRQSEILHTLLESMARLAHLDSVVVTDTSGLEILGLQYAVGADDYAISIGTDLGAQSIVRGVVDEGYIGATGLARTGEGIVLYTAVPVYFEEQLTGIVLVGQLLQSVLDEIKASSVADIVFYGADGILLQTTLDAGNAENALSLAPEIFTQVLTAVQQVPVQALSVNGTPYEAAYLAFNYGPTALGVIGTLMPNNLPFTTEIGRQLTALLASVLAGTAVIAAFIGIVRITTRVEAVTQVAEALAEGKSQARTGMRGHDEVGALGQALDIYADYVQEKQEELKLALRRKRRESAHLMAVLESLPDGVIVQDLDGRVILMNDHARRLLGSQRVFRSAGLHELAAIVSDGLGMVLAPGLYALGDPQQIELDGTMLSAQAAAIMSASDYRLGTVIVLRNITEHVRQEQARDVLLGRLMEEIQQPLAGLGRTGGRSQTEMVSAFAREITRQAVALQKWIVEMREFNEPSLSLMQRAQKPIRLETLIWAVANEWRQIAQAAKLTLHVIIERKGLYVLGDEKRLRWALGNIVDNAIKYTLPDGALTLEIQEESGTMARLRVRDNGVGIAKDDLPHVFTRFYRGTPVTKTGEVIHVPGMGQGLSNARQIFEGHGGTLFIKSNQGVGTAVYIALPVTSGEAFQLPYFEESDMDGETVLLEQKAKQRKG